jgi:hypothetical protein
MSGFCSVSSCEEFNVKGEQAGEQQSGAEFLCFRTEVIQAVKVVAEPSMLKLEAVAALGYMWKLDLEMERRTPNASLKPTDG